MWNAQSHQIWQKSRPVAFNLASDIRRIRYDVDIILRKDQFDRRGRGMQGRHLVTLPYRKARNQIETGYYSPKVLTSSGPALVATFASPWTMMRICSTISGLASVVTSPISIVLEMEASTRRIGCRCGKRCVAGFIARPRSRSALPGVPEIVAASRQTGNGRN